MVKSKKHLAALQVLLLIIAVLHLSSCEAGNEIVSVEVSQLPDKMVYIAGVDESLDMAGCMIRLHIRNGSISDIVFDNWPFVFIRHEIDFSTPGEYAVRFYWGEEDEVEYNGWPRYLHTMTIQIVSPD